MDEDRKIEQQTSVETAFDELIVNIKFLACAVKGEKLSSSTGNLVGDKMWFGTVTRWVCGEGRDSTHDMIRKLIKSDFKNFWS